MLSRLLTALERRYARYALSGFTYYLVATMGFVFVMELVSPGFHQILTLDPERVWHGQVWRLLTWLVIPPSFDLLGGFFSLYWQYTLGMAFEAQWGPPRYQLFWILGALLNTIAAFAFGIETTNVYLLMSLFLGFATLFPEYELLVFFAIPVKVKYLAVLDALGLLAMVGVMHGWQRLAPLLGIGNYLLFFTPDLLALLGRGRARAARMSSAYTFHDTVRRTKPVTEGRVCKSCGVTDEDPAVEFRVCTCSKCGEPTNFCLKHAREH